MRAGSRSLWVVSELYAPELTSTGYFITRIAEHLARDHSSEVFALASQPTYAARGVQAPSAELLNGVEVRRFWSPALRKDTILGRVANLLVFTSLTAWRLLRQVSPDDIILVVTNPPPLPYVAALVARLRHARLILLVHDMYPEVLLAGGMATQDSLIVRIMHRTSAWLYRTADCIVVLGRDMRRLVSAKLTSAEVQRIAIIPNWASLDEVRATSLKNRSPNGTFTVQHAGNMGRGHDVEILMRAAERLPHVDFVFVGNGAKREWIERAILMRSLTNVRVTDYRPRAELSESLGDCDIAAISFVAGMSGVSVPSRMYNVLAAGRPIIAVCEADSELALVVSEESVGWVVPPGDVDALIAAIDEASHCRAELSTLGIRARCVAESKYSQAVVMRAYDELVVSLENEH